MEEAPPFVTLCVWRTWDLTNRCHRRGASHSLRLRLAVSSCHIQCSTECPRRCVVQPNSTCCLRHHLQASLYPFPSCLSGTYTKGDGSDVLRSRTVAAMWQTNTMYLLWFVQT